VIFYLLPSLNRQQRLNINAFSAVLIIVSYPMILLGGLLRLLQREVPSSLDPNVLGADETEQPIYTVLMEEEFTGG